VAGDFQTFGPSGVFFAVCPEYTIEDFIISRDNDPLGWDESNPLASFGPKVFQWEQDVLSSLYSVHHQLRMADKRRATLRAARRAAIAMHANEEDAGAAVENTAAVETTNAVIRNSPPSVRNIDLKATAAIRSIVNRKNIWTESQFVQGRWSELFEPQVLMLTTGLKDLREYSGLLFRFTYGHITNLVLQCRESGCSAGPSRSCTSRKSHSWISGSWL
jgi:hypothetical protein